jgi:hypothetical protein
MAHKIQLNIHPKGNGVRSLRQAIEAGYNAFLGQKFGLVLGSEIASFYRGGEFDPTFNREVWVVIMMKRSDFDKHYSDSLGTSLGSKLSSLVHRAQTGDVPKRSIAKYIDEASARQAIGLS